MSEESAAPFLQPEALAQELIGSEVDGRYRVLEQIGGGGMGSIFRVEHTELRRQFAMKVLKMELSHDRAMVERFRREARVAASLSSEHVVAIVDSGVLADRRPYYVMDLLLGSDLRRLLSTHGTLAPARVANLGIDVCRGLSAAHSVGLIHRDLKPENLFVTRGDDGRDVCKILDFGVAKASEAGTTRPGALVGTVRYMAPEQVGLDAPVGPRTDLHALGVILYECLCGELPFNGDTTERALYGIMNGTPVPLRTRCPELPVELAAAVTRAFARNPEERYASALALAEALLPFAVGRQASPAEGWWVEVSVERNASSPRYATAAMESAAGETAAASQRARGSFPWGITVASLLAGAIAVGAVWSVVERRGERPAPRASLAGVTSSVPARSTPSRPDGAPPEPPVLAASSAEASVKSQSSASPANPARALRPPRAPSASPRLPPSPSFDSANPYAE